jgi:hypothetical protein
MMQNLWLLLSWWQTPSHHFPIREHLRPRRSPSPRGMCVAEPSGTHIRLIHTQRGEPSSCLPQNRYPIPGTNMAARHKSTGRGKSLRLACWKADGVGGRKIEMENLLGQHDVGICLLSETFLNPEKAFRFANYVCHCTAQSNSWGWQNYTGPAWHSSPLGTANGPHPARGNYHTKCAGR